MGLFPVGEENKPKQGESEVELPQICGTMPRCSLFTSRSEGSVHAVITIFSVMCIFLYLKGWGTKGSPSARPESNLRSSSRIIMGTKGALPNLHFAEKQKQLWCSMVIQQFGSCGWLS